MIFLKQYILSLITNMTTTETENTINISPRALSDFIDTTDNSIQETDKKGDSTILKLLNLNVDVATQYELYKAYKELETENNKLDDKLTQVKNSIKTSLANLNNIQISALSDYTNIEGIINDLINVKSNLKTFTTSLSNALK